MRICRKQQTNIKKRNNTGSLQTKKWTRQVFKERSISKDKGYLLKNIYKIYRNIY